MIEIINQKEQKLSKLEVISAISNRINEETILEIAEKIKTPQMTKEQKKLADKIFATDKSYQEQIDDFVREFNVPKERESQIRKFLKEAKLNEKYLTPLPIEKQIAVIKEPASGKMQRQALCLCK